MANKQKIKQAIRQQRHKRTRVKIFGTDQKPRLHVFRSLKHVYAQLINDQEGKTLVAAKDLEIKAGKDKRTDVAFKVGEALAAKAQKLGIKEAVFDKSYYKYHGRIKAVADGARQGGLKF